MKRCCKIFALLVLVLANSVSLKAQKEPLDMYQPGIKSPEANNLDQFGEIPVTLFNGLPSITVPLTTVNCGDLEFPISLDYYAGGNRPALHPGWTGLGWTLSSGGVITRQRNGDRDEYKDMRYPNADWSYWTNKGGIGSSNWNTVGFLQDPPLGGSLSPDEFSFNVHGIAGSFFLNYDGTWKVKSKQNIKVDVEVDPPTDYTIMIGTYAEVLPRTFSKFTLITGDGTRYIFGGQQNAIEFSYPALPSKEYFGGAEAYGDYYENNPAHNSVEANAWHLVKIISPKGHTVDFMYSTTPTFTFNQTTYTYFHHVDGTNNDTYGYENNETNKNLVTVYYLEKIVVDNTTEYSFSTSLSNELHWTWVVNWTIEKDFGLFGFGTNADDYKCYKLDNLKVIDAGNLIQDISFEYIENSNERLKLKKVVFKETKNELRNVYEFEYNSKLLPPYNTMNEDHWGYYNGRPLYDAHGLNPVTGAAYGQQRDPDAAFMNAEILQKMIYPSGGSTQFIFEPHEYSSVVSQYPSITCNSINQNKVAGGLRIRKIINNDNVGGTVIKEFFYVKDYLTGGALSSGVLSGTPKYYEEGSYTTTYGPIRFSILSSSPLNYLNNTNGNHITYSEVVEKNGEGFIVHKFQNHDNGFIDRPAFATYFPSTDINPDLYVNKSYAKLELERGLQTSESYYSASLQLLKEIKYEYNDDPGRYEDYVRCISNYLDYPGGILSYLSAYPIYTFFPYLKKEITKEYSQNGSGTAMIKTKEYEYDVSIRNLKREKFTNSAGEQIVTDYKYPSDLVATGQDPTGVYSAMVQKHMLSSVVESKTTKGNNHLRTTKNNFYSPAAGIYVPSSVHVQEKNDPMEPRLLLNRYDSEGNLLELQKNNDIKQVYLWGYNSRYPVAKIVGADYIATSNIVNQSVLNHPSSDQALRAELEKLRTNLPGAMVTTYTYSPLKGITSETNPQGKSIFYEYDGFNRLTLVKDQNNNIVKMICYNYAGQPENCKKPEYNTVQWRMFTKNDCGAGYIGGEWKVLVPAYSFFSYIDVNDANAKALAFINAIGQDDANKNGKCTLICTTGNCTGINKKCINNVCETGIIQLESSQPMGGGSYWMCTYYYLFSDGSVSTSWIEWSPGECLNNPY